MPSVVLQFAVVVFDDVAQQTPRAVTLAPPSSVTLPPPLAVVCLKAEMSVVVTTGSYGPAGAA